MGDCVIRLSGNVAQAPQIRHTPAGVTVATVRVGWSERWVDRQTGEWRTGASSFLTVTCWRRLAENVMNTLALGDPVIVEGRLSLRAFTTAEGEERSRWEVEATRLGPDLNRISGQLHRPRRTAAETAAALDAATDPAADAATDPAADEGEDGAETAAAPGPAAPAATEFGQQAAQSAGRAARSPAA